MRPRRPMRGLAEAETDPSLAAAGLAAVGLAAAGLDADGAVAGRGVNEVDLRTGARANDE